MVLGTLHSIIGEGDLPSVIVANREIILMKAISTEFLGSTHFLCIWKINKNISTKCKKLFETRKSEIGS